MKTQKINTTLFLNDDLRYIYHITSKRLLHGFSIVYQIDNNFTHIGYYYQGRKKGFTLEVEYRLMPYLLPKTKPSTKQINNNLFFYSIGLLVITGILLYLTY
jgi:hypothetical protein